MAITETYRGHKITWRQSLEHCIAHVWPPNSAAVFFIEATFAEGLDVLKARTHRAIDGRLDDQNPNLDTTKEGPP